jgi:hypothetical protein|eukprot:30850-Pelagococcus_subviridis.AAC.28
MSPRSRRVRPVGAVSVARLRGFFRFWGFAHRLIFFLSARRHQEAEEAREALAQGYGPQVLAQPAVLQEAPPEGVSLIAGWRSGWCRAESGAGEDLEGRTSRDWISRAGKDSRRTFKGIAS